MNLSMSAFDLLKDVNSELHQKSVYIPVTRRITAKIVPCRAHRVALEFDIRATHTLQRSLRSHPCQPYRTTPFRSRLAKAPNIGLPQLPQLVVSETMLFGLGNLFYGIPVPPIAVLYQ